MFAKNVLHPDHPRSRGVYLTPVPLITLGAGSSPLARGLHGSPVDELAEPRIIPARAGFTRMRTRRRQAVRDHPRSRGVYRNAGLVWVQACGIIPARAGFTGWRAILWSMVWDHPRSRGVYSLIKEYNDGGGGSSPLARGLPRVHSRPGHLPRIIPARAGFTGVHSAAAW